MNWTMQSNDERANGIPFPGLSMWELKQICDGLADAIEDWIEDMEYLLEYGERCEICGEFRICETRIGECKTPTDRGMKVEYEEEAMCQECWDGMNAEPDWDSIADERRERSGLD